MAKFKKLKSYRMVHFIILQTAVPKLKYSKIHFLFMIFYAMRSESRCALRLRYIDLVVSVEVAVEVCCCFTVFSFKQQLKCNIGKVSNCLIQFLLTMFLSIEERTVFQLQYKHNKFN
jgi:hypothetical protein